MLTRLFTTLKQRQKLSLLVSAGILLAFLGLALVMRTGDVRAQTKSCRKIVTNVKVLDTGRTIRRVLDSSIVEYQKCVAAAAIQKSCDPSAVPITSGTEAGGCQCPNNGPVVNRGDSCPPANQACGNLYQVPCPNTGCRVGSPGPYFFGLTDACLPDDGFTCSPDGKNNVCPSGTCVNGKCSACGGEGESVCFNATDCDKDLLADDNKICRSTKECGKNNQEPCKGILTSGEGCFPGYKPNLANTRCVSLTSGGCPTGQSYDPITQSCKTTPTAVMDKNKKYCPPGSREIRDTNNDVVQCSCPNGAKVSASSQTNGGDVCTVSNQLSATTVGLSSTCTIDTQCSTGYCTGGKCVKRAGTNETCTETRACIPGLVCSAGICIQEVQKNCPPGTTLRENANTCICNNNLNRSGIPINSPNNDACKSVDGSVCDSSEDCKSGLCSAGICVNSPASNLSKNCPAGSSKVNEFTCSCSDFTNNGNPRSFSIDDKALPSACLKKATNDRCQFSSECSSNFCLDGFCRTQCSLNNPHGACRDASQRCILGSCKGFGADTVAECGRATGRPLECVCGNSNQCTSGSCRNGVCSASQSLDQRCSPSAPCAVGLACVNYKCISPVSIATQDNLALGNACTLPVQCASGNCYQGKCSVQCRVGSPTADGQACFVEGWTATGTTCVRNEVRIPANSSVAPNSGFASEDSCKQSLNTKICTEFREPACLSTTTQGTPNMRYYKECRIGNNPAIREQTDVVCSGYCSNGKCTISISDQTEVPNTAPADLARPPVTVADTATAAVPTEATPPDSQTSTGTASVSSPAAVADLSRYNGCQAGQEPRTPACLGDGKTIFFYSGCGAQQVRKSAECPAGSTCSNGACQNKAAGIEVLPANPFGTAPQLNNTQEPTGNSTQTAEEVVNSGQVAQARAFVNKTAKTVQNTWNSIKGIFRNDQSESNPPINYSEYSPIVQVSNKKIDACTRDGETYTLGALRQTKDSCQVCLEGGFHIQNYGKCDGNTAFALDNAQGDITVLSSNFDLGTQSQKDSKIPALRNKGCGIATVYNIIQPENLTLDQFYLTSGIDVGKGEGGMSDENIIDVLDKNGVDNSVVLKQQFEGQYDVEEVANAIIQEIQAGNAVIIQADYRVRTKSGDPVNHWVVADSVATVENPDGSTSYVLLAHDSYFGGENSTISIPISGPNYDFGSLYVNTIISVSKEDSV